MNSKLILSLGLAFYFFTQIAFADDADLTKRYSDCMEKSGGVTVNMNDCINEETQNQDARLNKAYKELIALLSTGRRKEVQEAQRAWLKFRELNCNFYAEPNGGTLERVNANSCFMSTTAKLSLIHI